MEAIYPAGPAVVPAGLTRASRAYRQRAWLAVAGLLAFVLLYFALTGWFMWTAWRLLRGALDGNITLPGALVAGGAVLFSVFMLKALFFVKRGSLSGASLEVRAEDQPQLFALLHRLADEAGAPRPHRVYLTPPVNACVFYDLSLVNLLLPSRKSLEIGLGLVNVLSLGELKAVLAHEFGHFAQRSMNVGRWVYISQQVVGQLIARRDAFDRFLQQLSRVDLRIAWLGWVMQLIVWSIRSLMETLFRLVVLAQRALAREMELQADLVAVSVSGSDALVHALYRLGAADDAWGRALRFAEGEKNQSRPVADVFALQARMLEQLRRVFGKPEYGLVPPLPGADRPAHRLFSAGFAQPPRMWATHPPSTEREDNAKRVYVEAPVDERPAWCLFQDAENLRRQVSVKLAGDVKVEFVPVADSLERLDQVFERAYLDRRYRGAYLGRSPVRFARSPAELYGQPPAADALARELSTLYGEELGQALLRQRELEEEKAALEALRNSTAEAREDLVHRGAKLRRWRLPLVIAQVEKDLAEVRSSLQAHEVKCRTLHLAAAAQLGPEWQDYLKGLAAVLHYADHVEADLADLRGWLRNLFSYLTAGGRLGKDDRAKLIQGAGKVHAALVETDRQKHTVQLDPGLQKALGVQSWAAGLGDMTLQAPTAANLQTWFGVIEGWLESRISSLGSLRNAALDQLLAAEAQVAEALRSGVAPPAAPAPASRVTEGYATLQPGRERPLHQRLHWWDRFRLAHGLLPSLARSAVALAIVGGVLAFSGGLGNATVNAYNGLARPVRVSVNGHSMLLRPGDHAAVELPPKAQYKLAAETVDGHPIESFEAKADESFGHYVYNVAGAAPLGYWVASYGNAAKVDPRPLGAPRWSQISVDYAFEQPPHQIESKSGGGTKSALSGLAENAPQEQLEFLHNDAAAQHTLAASHARWDPTDSPSIWVWLQIERDDKGFADLLAARLREAPQDVLLRRIRQDEAKGAAHDQICAADLAEAAAAPADAGLQYLAARCQPDPASRDRAFTAAWTRWPDYPWLAYAEAYVAAGEERWQDADSLMVRTAQRLPAAAPFLAVDRYRISRVLDGADAGAAAAASTSGPLREMLALESGQGIGKGPQQAYPELAQGHLHQALAYAGDGESGARILRLVAASDGASADTVARALALPADQGMDIQSAWSTLGLALREHRDPAPYISHLRASGFRPELVERALAFVQAARPGMSEKEVQAMLDGLDPELRGEAYSAAAVALGRKAPPHWKWMASKLLFASERPSFG